MNWGFLLFGIMFLVLGTLPLFFLERFLKWWAYFVFRHRLMLGVDEQYHLYQHLSKDQYFYEMTEKKHKWGYRIWFVLSQLISIMCMLSGLFIILSTIFKL
jgi:hypothetical protein